MMALGGFEMAFSALLPRPEDGFVGRLAMREGSSDFTAEGVWKTWVTVGGGGMVVRVVEGIGLAGWGGGGSGSGSPYFRIRVAWLGERRWPC